MAYSGKAFPEGNPAMTEQKKKFNDPPPGSAFTLSAEDLLARAASWDVHEEAKGDTQRLVHQLADALSKERSGRASFVEQMRAADISSARAERERLEAFAELEKARAENLLLRAEVQMKSGLRGALVGLEHRVWTFLERRFGVRRPVG